MKDEHNNYRQTKIIATLGPATDKDNTLSEMIDAGLNVARINFSHGKAQDHIDRANMVREAAKANGKFVGILADLQGPKIRIGKFTESKIHLEEGDKFILDAQLDEQAGNQERVGLAYKDLIKDVNPDDILFLDDGNIALTVNKIKGHEIITTVIAGGPLSDNKGINLKGGGLSAPTLTEKDHADIKTAAEMKADFLALSFVRNAVDIEVAREIFRAAGGTGKVVAKIERTEAIENIDEIIEATDAVMLARGDLGVEIGDAELPGVQKAIIKKARVRNRVTIVATQMMQSMVESPIPTRAEVLDVANAVLDGTDSVMLSAETAVGNHPLKVIEAMDRICRGAERQRLSNMKSHLGIERSFTSTDEAIAMSAMFAATRMDVTAIVALTESGDTAKWLSRVITNTPVFAVSKNISTNRRVSIFRGVHAVNFDVDNTSGKATEDQKITQELLRRRIVKPGEKIILTKGDALGVSGGTNVMKIIQV